MENERSHSGEPWWKVGLRSAVPVTPADAEPRAWALPEGLKLEQTWSTVDNPLWGAASAIEVADDADDEGKYTRLHSFWRPDDPDSSGMMMEYVVDIFDSPTPNRD
jgi:hypothetical protein